MKKLLVLLFSILISFNSYGEWTKLFGFGNVSFYINLETLKERDGYVYFWLMDSNNDKSNQGLIQGDCDIRRIRLLEEIDYYQPMAGGVGINQTKDDSWEYLPPDSDDLAFFLDLACELAEQTLEEKKTTIEEWRKPFEEAEEKYNRELRENYLLGEMFPSIQGKDFYTNETIQVASLLANKMTLVNFWASWDVTSQAEHKKIMEISKQQDIQLIGINYKDLNSDAKEFLELRGNPFDVIISDPEGVIGLELGVYATPETFLVDKNGLIISKHIGEINDETWKVFEDLLTSIEEAKEKEEEKAKLQSAWIHNIAAEVRSNWRFSGENPDWFVKVLVTQNKEGEVLNISFGENNVGNSDIGKAFLNSVERAVYKSIPLPIAPDVSVWDKNIMFMFTP